MVVMIRWVGEEVVEEDDGGVGLGFNSLGLLMGVTLGFFALSLLSQSYSWLLVE